MGINASVMTGIARAASPIRSFSRATPDTVQYRLDGFRSHDISVMERRVIRWITPVSAELKYCALRTAASSPLTTKYSAFGVADVNGKV